MTVSEVAALVLTEGILTQATSSPDVSTYFSISWLSVHGAVPAPPQVSSSKARKMMSRGSLLGAS